MARLIASVLILACAVGAHAAEERISGKVHVVKPGKLAKFVSKSKDQPGETPFALPTPGSSTDPTIGGAVLTFADLGLAGGLLEVTLDASGWTGLGNPAGSKGYKYRGKNDIADPNPRGTCSNVLLKDRVIKAVCKGPDVTLSPPYNGAAAIEIAIPAAGPIDRYCSEFGGVTQKNTNVALVRKFAPPPTGCSLSTPGPTPTPVPTPTPTNSPAPPTPTPTPTPTSTPAPCTGLSFGGACWFKGTPGQSCDTVCSGVGRTYDTATRTVAGSDGSQANCQAVASGFGDVLLDSTINRGGIGCYRGTSVADWDQDPTTSTATQSYASRYCACQ